MLWYVHSTKIWSLGLNLPIHYHQGNHLKKNTFAAKTIVFVDILSWLTVSVQITFLFCSRIFKWTASWLPHASIWTIRNCSFSWWVTSNLAPPWDRSRENLKSNRTSWKNSGVLECLKLLKREVILWWSKVQNLHWLNELASS